MKETRDADDDIRFDRLVDGELNEDEYRELLSSLDDEPGGWRRCAMAFLEAQAWSKELRAQHKEAEAAPVAATATSAKSNYAGLLLAVAASFLCAFLLGLQFRGGPSVAPQPPAFVDGSRSPSVDVPAESIVESGEPVMPPGPNRAGHVTLVMDRPDGSSEEIDLPVFDVDNEYGRFLLENSTAIPAHLRRTLQDLGYEVHRDLRWAPFELDEGRRMFVPYGEVEIKPVANRSFQ